MSGAHLILASGSPVRRRLLGAAGVSFTVKPADLDETGIIEAQRRAGGAPDKIAGILAQAKAQASARGEAPDTLVLGADQILVQDGEIFEKPRSIKDVRDRLLHLRGQSHTLICAAALVRGETVVWRHTDHAHLHVRSFSDAFLDAYTDRHGADVMGSVGAYLLESEGIQLFERIEGDYFTILGLPMLPLMDALRRSGVLSE